MHGRWQLVVRRPNGTVVSRHTFENAYDGGTFLADVLARQITVGLWEAKLVGTACPGTCTLGETGTGDAGSLTTTWTGGAAKTFSISGDVTTPDTGTITSVASLNDACPNTDGPAEGCNGAALGQDPFTATTVAGVTAHAGDTVAVTVTFSFSASPQLFAAVLSRNVAVGFWWGEIFGSACPTGICQSAESGADTSFPAGPGFSTDLMPTVSGKNLVIAYDIPASAAGTITGINLENATCSAADDPSTSCPSGNDVGGFNVNLTNHTTGAGQFMDVTATLVFS